MDDNKQFEENAAAMDDLNALFQSNPHINILFDDHFRLVNCNQAALDFLGLTDKEEMASVLVKMVQEATPEKQSDGRDSKTIQDRFADVMRDGATDFVTELVFGGHTVVLNVCMKRIPYRGSFAVVAFLVDLSDLYSTRKALLDRDRLLSTVNEVASRLLTSGADDLDVTIRESMGIIGGNLGLDRMHLWRCIKDAKEPSFIHVSAWNADEFENQDVLDEIPVLTFRETVPTWEKTLKSDDVINGPLKDLPEADRLWMDRFDVKGILVVPMFQNEELWGFMTFDDCHVERTFPQDAVQILRSAALMLASAIVRAEALEGAVAASKAKGDFLSNMSHEMRTPLNAIIGMTSIGKRAVSLERKDYAFMKIGDASSHLLAVINDVLDMSKIEANKLDLVESSFSLAKLINGAAGVVSLRMEEHRQSFDIEVDPQIPDKLIGDDQRLSQVITNLLSNATKFTHDGGEISLSATLAGRSGGGYIGVLFKVSDTGIGISEEQLGRLFNSFEQAESGTSRKYGGTGLGLALSQRIIELMGGHIDVESELGRGATFMFTILLKEDTDKSERLDESKDAGAPEIKDFTGRRIMLVEDVEINREIVITLLEPTNISIETAENGRIALDMYKTDPARYDTILMDVQMPEMDGLTATSYIRIHEQELGLERTPIIAMTANVFREDVQTCLDAGMDDHIGKPLDIIELMEKLVKRMG